MEANNLTVSVDRIRRWLSEQCDIRNPAHQKALERGCLFVYGGQTRDEQAYGKTRYDNNVGFNRYDARFGTWLANEILRIRKGESKYQSLSPRMYEALRKMLVKYAKQIALATQNSVQSK